MAGQPLKRAIVKALTEIAVEEIGDEATALDLVCAHLETGAPLKALRDRVADVLKHELTREYFSTTIHKLGPDAKERIAQARRDAAPEMVELAREIIDDAPTHDKTHFEKAKERSKMLVWQASVLDKQTYGQQQQATNVNVFNVGQAHLDAFRAINAQAVPSQIAPQSLQDRSGATIPLLPVSQPSPTE